MLKHTIDPTSLFATRMKKARLALGISQAQLGIQAGIDEFGASARINQYERSKHAPDFLTAQNLATVLGVPTAYFYAENDGLAELILMFGKLKSTDRKTVLHFAESLLANNATPPPLA